MNKVLRLEDHRMYAAALRLSVGECLAKGGMNVEDTITVIKKLAAYDKDDFTDEQIENDVYDAYAEACKQEKGKRSPMEMVGEYIDSISFANSAALFYLKDCYNDLGFKTPAERHACRMAVNRFVGKRLTPLGNRSGAYSIIKKVEAPRTKFIETTVPEFPVRLPINLNDIIKLHAKNIIILAGTKSGGKTAILLKIALENQARMPVVYLNSEMGDEEFTERMKKFGVERADEIQFDVIECHHNFHEYITGEKKIFIIDFMEIHDAFYEIAKDIRAIHEKLDQGICIIAIQKKAGAALGRGAEFSMEKARLYVNLDYSEAERATKFTIVDAKTPKRDGVRGAFRFVKIIDGWRLQPKDDWRFQV